MSDSNEKQMSPAEMKTLVLKCMAGFSSGDLSALDGCFHDDYKRNVTPGLKGVSSFAEHVADLRNRHAVLQDARFELEEIIAEGDTVAVRFAMTGVHTGESWASRLQAERFDERRYRSSISEMER
jgi:ketosteroid isomerase-like protein